MHLKINKLFWECNNKHGCAHRLRRRLCKGCLLMFSPVSFLLIGKGKHFLFRSIWLRIDCVGWMPKTTDMASRTMNCLFGLAASKTIPHYRSAGQLGPIVFLNDRMNCGLSSSKAYSKLKRNTHSVTSLNQCTMTICAPGKNSCRHVHSLAFHPLAPGPKEKSLRRGISNKLPYRWHLSGNVFITGQQFNESYSGNTFRVISTNNSYWFQQAKEKESIPEAENDPENLTANSRASDDSENQDINSPAIVRLNN